MKNSHFSSNNNEKEGSNTRSEQNKILIRRAVEEVWNGGNFDILDELITNDFIIHSSTPGEEIQGHKGVKQFYTKLREAFPDIHFTIENQVAEGDKVVTHWIARATHKGEFKGIPPTGNQVNFTAIDIDRLVNGKVVECWTNVDELGLLQQLGVILTPVKEDQKETREAWDKIALGYDRTNTPTQMWLGNESLRRTGLCAGMRFLDVAAGSGALSIPAARLGAQVLATDLSPAMLELLRARANREGLNIETRVMDGHAFELDDNTFDMVGSQFGVMLFPNMPKGISEMVRVVKPGGCVLINVYGDPHKIEFLGFLVEAAQSVRPNFNGPPTNPPPLPFQLADPERLRQEYIKARLKNIIVETITETTEFQSGKDLLDWIVYSNPLAEIILGSLNLSKNERDIIQQQLEKMVRKRAGGRGTAKLTNPINIGIGTK